MKKLFLFLITVLGVTAAFAGRVTEQQALQKAQAFMQEKCVEQGKLFNQNSLHRAPQVDAASHACYVFNMEGDGGFVIVSGDDRTAEILGYATNGSLDQQTMPENLRAWLQEYERQIEWIEKNDYRFDQKAQRQPSAAIEPLLSTTWNQSTPYNDSCPLFFSTGQRCVTGCVATAMAQVLAYYGLQPDVRKPAGTTVAIPAYQCKTNWSGYGKISVEQKDPVDFDWENMLTSYNGSETSTQRAAVATLMEYCGASVHMNYGLASKGSSAYSKDIPDAFHTYFDFDCRRLVRADYSYNRWTELVYSELADSRPVLYGGQSSGGGHAFVVDGYKDGLFHVNWGWGGHADGFFLLSVLNSGDNSGIGASTTNDGYSYEQEAIIGIMPADGTFYEPPLEMTFWNINMDGNVIVYSAYNFNKCTETFDYGMGFADGTTITPITSGLNTNQTHEYGYGKTGQEVVIDGNSLQPGSYAIIAISKLSSSTEWQSEMSPDYNYIEAIVDDSHNVTLKQHPVPDVSATGLAVNGSHLMNEEQKVTAVVKNDGDEFYGLIYLFTSQDANSKGKAASKMGVTVQAGSTTDVSFAFTPDQTGTWYLWLAMDSQGNDVMTQTQVDISEDPYVPTGQLMVTALAVANADGDWEVDANGNRVVDVYSEESVLRISPTIKNISGSSLTGSIAVYLEKNDGDSWTQCANRYTASISGFPTGASSIIRETPFTIDGEGTYRFVLEWNGTVVDKHFIINYATSKAPDIVTGDVNGDGEVGIADIVAVTNVMAGITTDEATIQRADVNDDHDVGIADIVAITNIMAGGNVDK